MSRPRPIETRKFLACWDWGSSRLEKFLSVETENNPVCKISWMLKLRHMESRKFVGFWGLNQWWLGIRCQYKDSIKSLGQENAIFLHISSFQIVLWNLHSKFALFNLHHVKFVLCIWILQNSHFGWFCWFGLGEVGPQTVRPVHTHWQTSTPTEILPHQLETFQTHWNPSRDEESCPDPLKLIHSPWNLSKPFETHLDTLKSIHTHCSPYRPKNKNSRPT